MADWALIREKYQSTSIDWERLNAYAARVASELGDRDPLAPHWVLDSRFWRHIDKTPRYVETERNEIRYLLERKRNSHCRSIVMERDHESQLLGNA